MQTLKGIHIKILDEMVELEFMIKKDQELFKILWNQLLNELFESNTSMVVYGDNQGEPYLVKNRKVSQCMRHIDIHQHFCVTYRGRRR